MEATRKGMTMVRPGVYEEITSTGLTIREYCVGEIIADRRKQLKMSQQELAERVGVNRSTISRYESGTYKKISFTTLAQIAEALDMTEDYLWARTDNPHEDLSFPGTKDEHEQHLLDLFRNLSANQQKAVINMLEQMGGNSDASV